MTYKALTTNADATKFIVDSIVTDAVALGWAHVESSYTHGLLTYEILKNPSSLNYFGGEFHVALGYDTASKSIVVCNLFEQWNTTSKMATAFCPAQSSLTPTGSYTTNLSPAMLNSASNLAISSRTMFQAFMGLGGVGIVNNEDFWYSITEDRITIAAAVNSNNNSSRGAIYVGAYERLLPSSADPVPIVLNHFLGSSLQRVVSFVGNANSSVGGSTREPLTNSVFAGNFTAGFGYRSPNTMVAWTPVGLGDDNGDLDSNATHELYTNRPWVSRMPVMGRSYNAVRGLFIGLYFVALDNGNIGTEVRWTFAGNTYVATRMLGGGTANNRAYNKIYMEQL